jgi:hypothetical protein
LTLALTAPLTVIPHATNDQMPRPLTDEEAATLSDLVAGMPGRTANKSHKASDLINVMFVGSREQVAAAFVAAGWSETPRATLRSHLMNVRAVMANQGNSAAPMSTLLVDGEIPDMMWQKGLNDVGKRHHIRIWKRADMWNGQEIWVGAATHDIDFAFLRPGMPITHRISGMIDRERDKVVHDLVFTASVGIADWLERPEVLGETHNATGDRMTTDGRLAVVQLQSLAKTASLETAPLAAHGRMMQRFARREILSMRNELVRNNSYWRSYEAIRFAVAAARRHKDGEVVVAKAEPKAVGGVGRFVALR